MRFSELPFFLKIVVLFSLCWCSSCLSSQGAASAEEYFSIGMAYFELGRYEDAEKWLNRARAADKTKTASEYNLGRIAFETGRYNDAILFFDSVLAKDPENVIALKAAAYARIKTGDFVQAEALYDRVLVLVPESADDGYNYALVLCAMEQYEKAEGILLKYQFALKDNKDILLLYARTQRALNKVEAADSYAQWLAANEDPKITFEYASVLEQAELYARALEQYRACLSSLPQNSADPKKSTLRYTIARLLLTADPENKEGPEELKAAVSEGYADLDSLKALLEDERITAPHKEEIRRIIGEISAAEKSVPGADSPAENAESPDSKP
jgi:tetratricopeptide (TPR) repeat protein